MVTLLEVVTRLEDEALSRIVLIFWWQTGENTASEASGAVAAK